MLEGDREWNLVVRYPAEYRDSIDKIRNIKVGYTRAAYPRESSAGCGRCGSPGNPSASRRRSGFVSLFGVSVMNSILLLTFYNQARERDLAPLEAMHHAATKRMRPLLMTSLSACIGLLPAAISHGIGSQVQRPLATVIVGGMLLGPIMLLLAVPPLRMLLLGKETAVLQTAGP